MAKTVFICLLFCYVLFVNRIFAVTPIYSSRTSYSIGFSTPDSLRDSIKEKKRVNKFVSNIKTNGNITIGYNYGVIPFAFIDKSPTGFGSIEGNVGIQIYRIPVSATFMYTTLKNVSGLNNYFRLAFDAAKYRELMQSKLALPNTMLQDSINKLNEKILQAKNKLGYYSYMKNKAGDYCNQYQNLSDDLKDKLPDSLNYDQLTSNDTLFNKYIAQAIDTLNSDSIIKEVSQQDSLLMFLYQVYDFKKQYNLNTIDTAKYAAYIKDCTTQLHQYDHKVDSLRSLNNTLMDSINNINRPNLLLPHRKQGIKDILMNTKKFEIGLCYPNYSSFLVSGIAIRGVNYEYEKKTFYFATTLGKTINNMFFTNNLIENNLLKTRNPFNYFDFNNPLSGRNIAAVKFGAGKSNANHIHIGFLYGIGNNNIYGDTLESKASSIKERNYVMELDARVNIKSAYIQAIYGKSFLQNNMVLNDGIRSVMQGLFNADIRSNALMLKTVIPVTKIHNTLGFTFRMVDPFFKSYGVGFIRSDNIRYEVKTEQSLFKSKLKLGGFYRHEEDNILNLLSYNNVINSMGFNTTIRIKKNVNLRMEYSPLVQLTKFDGNSIVRKSSITNVIVTLLPGNNKIKSSLNVMGSFYDLSGETSNSKFYTSNMNLNTTLNKNWSNNFYAGWFMSEGSDSITAAQGNAFIINEELSLKNVGRFTLGANGKYSRNVSFGNQWGYGLKINVKFTKNISFDLSMDKVVVGDFYNSYPIALIKEFPYYCSTKLKLSW